MMILTLPSSILLYGQTSTGKTALIGELAKYAFKTTGKRTVVFTQDHGGYEPLQPHLQQEPAYLEVVDLRHAEYIWEAQLNAVEGLYPNGKPIDRSAVGVWAFEGVLSFANAIMEDLRVKTGKGIKIGGQSPVVNFLDGKRQVAGNSQADYGTMATHMKTVVPRSFRLPGTVLWTTLAKQGTDQDDKVTILIGPDAPGRQLMPELPSWFVYTFMLNVAPYDHLTGTKAVHRLYFESHKDLTTGGVTALGNARLALEADPLPPYIEPASIIGALEAIAKAQGAARARIAKEMGGDA